MERRDDAKFAAFQQWKEHLELAYGKNAFASRLWLERHMPRPMAKTQAALALETAAAPPLASPSYSSDDLAKIRDDIGSDCKRCKLCQARKNIVFGEGNSAAKLMFIGEGPGEQEDVQGRPFVGKAGQLLTKIIEAMGYDRADVYIANVVKCRPPGNRTPEPDEVGACGAFLFRQIDVIKPRVIVALGGTALKCLIDPEAKITRMRGRFITYRGVKFMPTYHPAFLLRNPEAKRDVWEDMKKVKAELESGS